MQVRNYYNEFDPKAAAWLRELIRAGLIPPGDVDERSITEIKPHELTKDTQCHFFAGIGGWSLALQLAGWDPARPVWTGSCPCQPFSSAGTQAGADDKRHLWPVFFNLIRECAPPVVFGEQVASALVVGKVGGKADAGPVWLDRVSADLESAGYTVGACVLGAHSVGAPHIRQRLYWVADAQHDGHHRQERLAPQPTEYRADGRLHRGSAGGLGNSRSLRCDSRIAGDGRGQEGEGSEHGEVTDRHGGLADGQCARCEGREREGQAGEEGASSGYACECGGVCGMGHAEHPRLERHAGHGDDGHKPGRIDADAARPVAEAGSDCRLPDPSSDMGGSGQYQPERGTEGRASDRGLDAWSRFDLIPCADGKTRRIEPGTSALVAGLPRGVVPSGDPCREGYAQNTAEARVTRLRGYGNSIVPQLAAEFIKAFTDIAP